ncbi:hypothetical protein OY671_011080, partial [Metschnikowia pulcherrima]
MTVPPSLDRSSRHEALNFASTNRIPRRVVAGLVGWISKSENPVVKGVSIGLWRLFTDIDLGDAKAVRFKSSHDCFTRESREGARPIDPDPRASTSPCDGIIVA